MDVDWHGSEVGRWETLWGHVSRCTGIRSATAGISNTATKWGSSDQSHHRTSDVIFCGVERLRMFKKEKIRMRRHHLSIDIETKSSIDIGKAGLYKYAQSPDFAILLFAYKWDDDPVQIWTIATEIHSGMDTGRACRSGYDQTRI